MIGHLCAVRVSDLNLRRRIYMLYLRNSPLSSAAEGFRRFLSDRPVKQEEAASPPAFPAIRPGKKRSRERG